MFCRRKCKSGIHFEALQRADYHVYHAAVPILSEGLRVLRGGDLTLSILKGGGVVFSERHAATRPRKPVERAVRVALYPPDPALKPLGQSSFVHGSGGKLNEGHGQRHIVCIKLVSIDDEKRFAQD